MTSKLDIAGDHIRAAIQMIAVGANPYSTHLIVMACEEMLRSIAEAKKVKLSGSFDDAIKPDRPSPTTPQAADPRRKIPAAPSPRSAESRHHEQDSHSARSQPIIRSHQ